MDTAIHKKSENNLPEYKVIIHVRNDPDLRDTVIELATILAHFPLMENESDEPVPEILLKHACCGSSFGGASRALTLQQLFAVWKAGRLIHSGYYAEDGKTQIAEKLYVAGMGFGLSGAYIFWGIVPSRNTIVIADRCPTQEIGSVASNMVLFNNAADGKELI